MREGVALVVMLAGCGRVGFGAEPLEVPPDAPRDPSVPSGCIGADEDRDGWPNACDTCPTVPNADQADRGETEVGGAADGVGDACDPRPAVSGDRVAVAMFHDGADPYELYNATSYTAAGALRLGTNASEGSASFTMPLTATRVEIAYTIVSSSNVLQWFGVWIHRAQPDAIFLEAAWSQQIGSGVWRIKEQNGGEDFYSADIVGPSRFSSGQRFRLVGDTALATGGPFVLRVTDLDRGVTDEVSSTITLAPAANGYLEAYRATIDFDYLVIYAAP